MSRACFVYFSAGKYLSASRCSNNINKSSSEVVRADHLIPDGEL